MEKQTTCIEETHMTVSDQNDNNQRQKCRNKIIECAKPKWLKREISNGSVFCCDIIICDLDIKTTEKKLRRSQILKNKKN